MLCAHSKSVRGLKETKVEKAAAWTLLPHVPCSQGTQSFRLKVRGVPVYRWIHATQQIPDLKREGACGSEKPGQGRTDLHHGLLVLAVFHLCCGQVNDATLYGVLVTVIDEDIRAADHDKMFSPVAGKWLLEMQISFLRDH